MSQYLTNSDIIILSGSSLGIGNSTPNASLDLSGSGIISGSLTVVQGITSSLFGTSSWAVSSSQTVTAQTASYVLTAQTASYVQNAVSSSIAVSSSYATTASYVLNAVSASYASNGGVTQLLAGPNVTLSPTNGLGQVTISSTSGGGGFNTATGSYGSFYSTQTQTNVAGTARSMSLNITDITNGVSISGSTNPFNTYIKTQNAGVYDIQFSAQVDKTDSGTDEIWIWLRKNGTDISDSATSIQLVGNGAHYVAAWNFFVNAAANDYFQLMWYSPDANVRLHAESAFGVVPGIPSLIVTANRVDQFLSNTGSFSGSFNGVFTGSLQGTSSWASNAISASYATTASYVLTAQTASYVLQAVSASFATTASYALNAGSGGTVSTSSLLTTASVASNVITFTKGDGSTFPITVSTGSGGGGSTFPYTGSAIISGSLTITGSAPSALSVLGNQTIKGLDVTNIGGTTTANASTTIVGSGTAFTSLSTGDRISLSSASTTYATITAIASDTSLTVSTALGNGTSQTINVKKNMFKVIDSGSINRFLINDRGVLSTTLSNILCGDDSVSNIGQFNISAPNISGQTMLSLQSNGTARFSFFNTSGYTQAAGGNSNGSINNSFNISLAGAVNVNAEGSIASISPASTFTITSTYPTQRFIRIGQPTIDAATALGISSAASNFVINGAVAATTSASISQSIGLLIEVGNSLGSRVTNGYGLYANAPIGATRNMAAYFAGKVSINNFPTTSMADNDFTVAGNALISGSLTITGSLTSTLGFTGSLQGTSSWASKAITASYVANVITRSINIINSSITASANAYTDYVYVASGSIIITLPTAVGNTNEYTIKNVGTSSITLAPSSSQTIDGQASWSLAQQYISITTFSNNSNWLIK